ncbi:MAG TPA: MGMT family protein [Longimicrobium sp.]|jgi:methylated-DNA-protein-cysteine methyltransferase-like protein|nr:MGMT family protein [Longimicrobium sp.]
MRAKDAQPDSAYDRIYAVVRRIPKGRVCTYGRVAALAGNPGAARQVGYALHALPEHAALPWHRVINAAGRISLRRGGGAELEQRFRLEAEGVLFDQAGRVSIERFGWAGKLRTGH